MDEEPSNGRMAQSLKVSIMKDSNMAMENFTLQILKQLTRVNGIKMRCKVKVLIYTRMGRYIKDSSGKTRKKELEG